MVRPDLKVRGLPIRPRLGFFCNSMSIRGMATNTGNHFKNRHGWLIRTPMRKSTLPSAPTSAENRPLLIVAIEHLHHRAT
uniref:Unannotated protein n=1 Tax=freshwater metagenome TaxID=449393 RepID=A0A6J7P5E1_9ZZZZ